MAVVEKSATGIANMESNNRGGLSKPILRRLSLTTEQTNIKPAMKHLTRVISFTSGKGGVGKTNLVVNLGVALAQRGHTVLMLDADLGLANIDVLLGVQPKYTLHEVLSGKKELSEVMVAGPSGVSIIPAASGVDVLRGLSPQQRLMLLEAVENLAYSFDYLLIDTGAGIGGDVMYFNSAATEIVCTITNEPTSLTDAYALIKVLSGNYGEKSISVIVNQVASEAEAKAVFGRLARSVTRFLQVELRYLGWIPSDPAVVAAVREQKALLELYPSSPAARACVHTADNIDGDFWKFRVKGGMQFFFKQLLELDVYGGQA
jgi:flagellar biosynthesis protein FlhG